MVLDVTECLTHDPTKLQRQRFAEILTALDPADTLNDFDDGDDDNCDNGVSNAVGYDSNDDFHDESYSQLVFFC